MYDLPYTSVATRFSDHAAQDGICCASILLRINEEHLLRIKLNCGKGNNTKDELLALWFLVIFYSILGIDTLNIYGDFLVIINWEKELWTLHVITLN